MSEFKWRHFEGEIILWAVRWYCRYGISYRDLELMLGTVSWLGVCSGNGITLRMVLRDWTRDLYCDVGKNSGPARSTGSTSCRSPALAISMISPIWG